mmetsp:Transcript_38052/g.81028  ORF Transcript_38052/g.81028 Transcript_38052/m.81028 type:complete len:185 (-) Transcript_38052:808-1362(-)
MRRSHAEPVHVVTGTPVGDTSDVPVGLPVDTEAQAQAHTARFRADLEEIALREKCSFQSTIDLAASIAQARVGESVQGSIRLQLPGALRAHLEDHPGTQQLVTEIGRDLQRRVEADAAGVVSRLASEETARRELSKAAERACMKRVDERMRSLWAAWFAGGAVTAGLWLVFLGAPTGWRRDRGR